MYIQFADGAQLDCVSVAGAGAVVAGHKRDVLTVTVAGEFAAVRAAFDGSPWAVVDGGNTYDKSGYTLPVSVCDNLDGTVTVRIARANTREEDLEDENAALQAENAEQTDIINILTGGES